MGDIYYEWITGKKEEKMNNTNEVARWINKRIDDGRSGVRPACSKCGEWGYTRWDIKTPYCPCCGVKMENGIKRFDYPADEEVEE